MLQVPFLICNYILPNLQVPCSTLREANHNNVLFTPESSSASYSLSKALCDCTSILKRFHVLFVPLCTLIQCLVLAMPPQSLKIDRLPSDASAILRERYLAGTFSVVTQCWLNDWVNNGEAGDLRRHRAPDDLTVMYLATQGARITATMHGIYRVIMEYFAFNKQMRQM